MEKFNVSGAPRPVGLYPHARQVGDLLFLSGIGPRDPETNQTPGLKRTESGFYQEFDFATQCRSVFQNLRTILEGSGARWENLVDVTVYLTNLQRDFTTYNAIYAEYFKEVMPCRTTIGIDSLPAPIDIEVKAIAWLGK